MEEESSFYMRNQTNFKLGASRTFLTVEHSLMSDLPLWARDRNPSLIHQLTVTVHYMVKILSVSSCLKCLFAAILDGYLNPTQNDKRSAFFLEIGFALTWVLIVGGIALVITATVLDTKSRPSKQ